MRRFSELQEQSRSNAERAGKVIRNDQSNYLSPRVWYSRFLAARKRISLGTVVA